jgi:hypothetical protein
MSVHDVGPPRFHPRANAPRSLQIPVGNHGNCRYSKAFGLGALDKWRIGSPDQERLVAPFSQTKREKKNLPLTSSPCRAGVQMQNPLSLHC